jgi:hypothetical protein
MPCASKARMALRTVWSLHPSERAMTSACSPLALASKSGSDAT